MILINFVDKYYFPKCRYFSIQNLQRDSDKMVFAEYALSQHNIQIHWKPPKIWWKLIRRNKIDSRMQKRRNEEKRIIMKEIPEERKTFVEISLLAAPTSW